MTQINFSNNPFSLMLTSFEPARFIGRVQEIETILHGVTAEHPRSFALLGPKTLGKSTLLRFLSDERGAVNRYDKFLGYYGPGREQKLILVYVDLYRRSGDEIFLQIIDKFEQKSRKDALLRGLLESAKEKAGDSAPLDKEQSKTVILKVLKKAFTENIRIVLFLDHLDYALKNIEPVDETYLRRLTDYASFVIAMEKTLSEIKDKWTVSPLLNVFVTRPVGFLTEDEAQTLIQFPVKGNEQRQFSKVETVFLLKAAGRHPYLLTLSGEFLFNLRQQYPDLKPEWWEDEQNRQWVMLQMETSPAVTDLFQNFWQPLKKEEKEVLLKISTGELKDWIADGQILTSLSQKALIYDDLVKKRINIFSELFANYIRHQEVKTVQVDFASIKENLSPLENKLLQYFLERPNELCTFDELITTIWTSNESDRKPSKRALEVAVQRLRDKFREETKTKKEYFVNQRGQGYRYVPE